MLQLCLLTDIKTEATMSTEDNYLARVESPDFFFAPRDLFDFCIICKNIIQPGEMIAEAGEDCYVHVNCFTEN